jgi:predicted kinase
VSFYLIVRGPLGAGKTTVARAVAERLGARVVSIDDLLDRFEWDGGSERLFRKANAVAAEQASEWLERGVPVVVDGNFYWPRLLAELQERLPYPH